MTSPRSLSGQWRERIPLELDRALDEHLSSPGARPQLLAALAARALDAGADIARREPIPDPITVGDLARMNIPVPETPVLDALWRQLPEYERGVLGRVALAHAIATDPARVTAARAQVAESLNRYQQIIVLSAARADATADLELEVLGEHETPGREQVAAAEQQRSLAASLAVLQSEVGGLRDQLVQLGRPDLTAGDAVDRWTRIFENSCDILEPLLTQTRLHNTPDPESITAYQGLVARLERAAATAVQRYREQGPSHTDELQLTGLTYLRAVRTLARSLPAAARPASAAGGEGSGISLSPPTVQIPAGGGLAR